MIRTVLRSGILFLFPLLFLSGEGLRAQSIVRGGVEGRVVGPEGSGIGEAEVGATETRTGVSHFAVTERDGTYRIEGLPAGEYTLLFEGLGYRPVLHTGVPVRPGRTLEIGATLELAEPPVVSTDTVAFGNLAGIRLTPGGGRWISRRELASTPEAFPVLGEITALSAGWDARGGSQGLPNTLGRVFVDGVPFVPAAHPFRTSDPLLLAALPRRGVGQVELHQTGADVEWAGAAGGYASLGTRAAGTRLTGSVSGHGSFERFWDSRAFRTPRPEGVSYWGGGDLDLPLAGGGARVFLSGEATSVITPRFLAVSGGLLSAAADGVGGPAAGLDRVWEDRTDIYSGLARLDWTLESGADILTRVNVSRAESGVGFFASPAEHGHASPLVATDVSGLVTVRSPVGSRFTLELRGGFERSEREFGAEAASGLTSGVPTTRVIEDRMILGGAPGSDGRSLRTALTGGPTIHFDLGVHRFKAGADVSVPFYEMSFGPPSAGTFLFSGPDELRARDGAYVATVGGDAETAFTLPRVGGFFQYRWSPAPELVLVSAVRWDHDFLPADRIAFNEEWFGLTGLANDAVASSSGNLGGRLGVTWDVTGTGSTVLEGSVAAHNGRIDPGVVHEAVLLDGPVGARRAVGPLGAWPAAPDPAVSGEPRTMLALLDPELRPPLTTRAGLTVAQTVGGGTTVRFSGLFRRTEFLPRRVDLNRLLLPVAESNLQRPVYGELAKVGSVVQAVPGSNRRFEDFDRVWALNTDGWSEYLAAGVGIEHTRGWLDAYAEYTFSRTEDNWLGASVGVPEARQDPGLSSAASVGGIGAGSGGGASWANGISDFDLPHRAVAGVNARFEGPLVEEIAVGGTFRLQSGFPFTPSYPGGTDVNGDGSGLNDPAFVPDDPAIRELAAEWDCLDAWIGRVVERNACRAPLVYSLDAHLHLTLLRFGDLAAELLLEGFNILDARTGPRDAALLLVDPDAPITGQGSGTVDIPTVVNPSFGDLLFPTGTGRRLRIGVRVGGT